LAERERAAAPPYGGVFVPRTRVMGPDDLRRAITRIAHEVVEHNHGLEHVIIIGLQTGGVPLAMRLAEVLRAIEGTEVPVGRLDVALHRDDIGIRPVMPEAPSDIPFDLTGEVVALDALNYYGRPRSVQLAVMVDRGHRELPIRPDYVGKNLPTRRDEMVSVTGDGVELGEVRRAR